MIGGTYDAELNYFFAVTTIFQIFACQKKTDLLVDGDGCMRVFEV